MRVNKQKASVKLFTNILKSLVNLIVLSTIVSAHKNGTSPDENDTNRPMPIPNQCVNVTLDPTQFMFDVITGQLDVTIGYEPITIRNHTLTNDTIATTVCYPLSPQLLTCNDLVQSSRNDSKSGHYRIDNHHNLHPDGFNNSILLGDYYLDGNGLAMWCNESIERSYRSPRCNDLVVTRNNLFQWRGGWILSNGDKVIRRSESASSVENYNEEIRVCYPLFISFLNCEVKLLLDLPHYEFLQNHSVHNLLAQRVVGPGDYFRDGEQVVVCRVQEDAGEAGSWFNQQLLYQIFSWFYVLSAFCMLVAVVYHLWAPKPNYHTRCHTSYAICVFVMCVCMSLRRLLPTMDGPSCYVLYTVTYLSTMASFFWLNVMAFDVWRYFSSLQTSCVRCFIGVDVRNRFLNYSAFAWAMPLLLFALSIAVDRIRILQRLFWLFPGIESLCWFNDRPSQWVFYYGPLAVLMTLNLGFFVVTIINLHHASKGTELVNQRRLKQLLKIAFKLYLVMGLCWISEIVTFAVANNQPFNYYSYVSSVLTGLQGVAICLIYIIRRRNFDHLLSHICPTRMGRKKKWASYLGHDKMAVSKTDSRISNVTIVSTSSSQPGDDHINDDAGVGHGDVTKDDHAPPDYETVEKSDL